MNPESERTRQRFFAMTRDQLDRWFGRYSLEWDKLEAAWDRYRTKIFGDRPVLVETYNAERHIFVGRFWATPKHRRLKAEYEAYQGASSRQARRDSNRRRRERIRNNAGIVPIDRSEIYCRDRGQCGICKRAVTKQKMTLDHIVPISRGGTDEPDNLQVAHRICNMLKGERLRVRFWCSECLRLWPRRNGAYLATCRCGGRWHTSANTRRHRLRPERWVPGLKSQKKAKSGAAG